MNFYKELADITDMKDDVKKMQDKALDIFHTNKKEVVRLLKELNSIEEEIEEIDREIEQIMKDLI